ncbi:MAG: ABC transporter ATP-binding protein [Actinobacteria bacterium]|nr:MAG: ABC transporter ATP-binding protein [Actinomycetota bacterium]
MATTNGSLISVEDVTVRFGGVIAVNRVSMAVPAGEIRGLIGPNGAGKTTLFDTITGMRLPSSGTVHFDGSDITSRSAVWRSRNGIRRTFQRQQPFGWLTVEDNVLVALDYRGGGGGLVADLVSFPARKHIEAQRRERARIAVERCGLADVSDIAAGKLSIGKIRLLEQEYEARRFADVVRQFRTDSDAAVLLVEHDVPFVMNLCDRVTVLNLGEVIAEGTTHEVANNPVVRAAYLG